MDKPVGQTGWTNRLGNRVRCFRDRLRPFSSSLLNGKSAVVLWFFTAWLIINWLGTAHKILQYYNPLPVGDYWRVVEDLHGFRSLDLSVFWRQHNEHRIVFPEIVFAVDMLWLQGRQLLPTVLNVCCYAGVWVMLAGATRGEKLSPLSSRILAAVLAGIVMGWPLNAFVLGFPFLLQWTLVQLAVVLALTLLAGAKNATRPLWLAGVISCGVITTFSSANGMLLWAVLIGAGLLFRMSKGQLAALATAAVLSTFIFLIGYRSKGNVDVLALLQHPVHCAGFVVSYVSMPFGVLRSPWVGFTFGSVSIAGWLALAIIAARTSTLSPVSRAVFFGYYTFLLLTALSTAAGRMDLQDAGFEAAKAGRYVTLPLVGWAALLQAAILVGTRGRQKVLWGQAITAIAAIVLLFMQVRLARWLRSEDQRVASQQLATLSVQNGITDDRLLNSIFPQPAFVRGYLPELKNDHLSIYADRASMLLGQAVPDAFPYKSGQTASGKVLRITQVGGGAEIVASTDQGAAHASTLLFVDEHGRIAGFGRRTTKALSVVLSLPSERGSTEWVGFINTQDKECRFSMFLADTRLRRVIPVADTVSVCGS